REAVSDDRERADRAADRAEEANEGAQLALREALETAKTPGPQGPQGEAAIIHDWLYDNALRTKKEADRIFLDAMKVLKVPAWRRSLMYFAVRLFGKGKYRSGSMVRP
ncbi:DUF1353 domain-containing protein, partial [Escherichia coli]